MIKFAPGPLISFKRNLIPLISCILFFVLSVPNAGADTTVSGTISADTTWTLQDSPYIVTSTLTVKGTDGTDGITTLTIEPGVEVRFNSYCFLKIGDYSGSPGSIKAQGSAAEPILFTSNASSPAPGSWYGLRFFATTDAASTILEHCAVQYAGYGGTGSIYINNASPTLSSTTIENSSNYDLYYTGTVGGTVSNCTLNSGIILEAASSVEFTGNTFNYNSSYPIKSYANNVGSLVTGNTYANLNEASYLEVSSSQLTKDATWEGAIPFYLTSNLAVQGTDGDDGITTLTIGAGAILRFNNSRYMKIGGDYGSPGSIKVQGSAAEPVVFTSNASSPAPGSWYGLRFYPTTDAASTIFEHCTVQYAGYGGTGSIYINNTSPTLSSTTIENSSNYDLYYTGTVGGTVSNCTLNSGIYLPATSSIEFSGNTFNYNNTYPIKSYANNVGSLVTGNTYANLDESSSLEILGGNVTKDATWTAAIPLCLKNNVIIQGSDGDDGITTLTIEPGAKIIFSLYKFLDVGGSSGAPGALLAQGRGDNMIIFTSNQSSPAPGNWGSLRFYNTSNDSASILKHCIVEYGGYGSSASVDLNNSNPSIEHSIIRYSSAAGIYSVGANSSDAQISCNTIANNNYGLYCYNGATPMIENNNFISNAQYGIYNYSQAELIAENNWWGDAAGPNTTGDATYGNVDADPWSLSEISCATVEENNPPDMPSSPTPADKAVRVTLSSGACTLQWIGGDPDLQDIVTYDMQWGTSADALATAVQDIVGNQYQMTDLCAGITYYWQVIAKDNHGLETAGPVWCFTSAGDTPDLTVGSLATDPAGNLQPGQSVTFSATIQNNSTGPVVDPFAVDLLINNASIGASAVDTIIPAGGSVDLTWTWTYSGGDPAIELFADSQSQVAETSEDNNQYTALLSEVADMTAPALVSNSPAQGAFLQQIQQISVTLADSQSSVDDAAVPANFTLIDPNQQSVAGTVSESSDTFTFIPNTLPLADGHYQVSVTAADLHGNSQLYTTDFTVDTTPPEKPVITGGTVASGTIQARPESNTADQFLIDLTGTREAGTSLWINGEVKVDYGDTDWSVPLVLQSGENAIEVWLKDRAGNQGPSEWVDIQVTTADAIHYEYNAAGRVNRIHSNP